LVIAQVAVAVVAMLLYDWRLGGLRKSRNRVKWIYGLMLAFVLYHLLIVGGAIRSYSFYDTALLVFGPAAKSLLAYFKTKG